MATNLALLSILIEDSLDYAAGFSLWLNVDTAQTAAQLITEAQTVAGLLDAITGGQILQVRMGLYVPLLGGWKSAPVALSACGDQAAIAFTNAGSLHPWDVGIPAILPAKLSGNKLNTSDTDVAAFINHLDANSGSYRYCTDGGDNLTGLSYTFLPKRKSRVAQARAG